MAHGRTAVAPILMGVLLLETISPSGTLLGAKGTRTEVRGLRGAVAAGHPLVAGVGMEIFHQGGNAVDSGLAMILAASVVEFNSFGFGGEMPTLIYSPRERRVVAVNGNTRAPRAASVEWFRDQGYRLIPGDGFLPAGCLRRPGGGGSEPGPVRNPQLLPDRPRRHPPGRRFSGGRALAPGRGPQGDGKVPGGQDLPPGVAQLGRGVSPRRPGPRGGRGDPPSGPGPHLPTPGRSREGSAGEGRRPQPGVAGRSRLLLQGSHRPGAGSILPGVQGSRQRRRPPLQPPDRGGLRRLRSPDPGTVELRLPRLPGLQVRTLDAGARLPPATGAAGRLRPGGTRTQQRRLSAPLAGDGQAGPRRQGEVLRRSRLRPCSPSGPPLPGLRQAEEETHRLEDRLSGTPPRGPLPLRRPSREDGRRT